MSEKSHDFIPATVEREVAPNVVFRPIRCWHSLTYAGEGLTKVNGDGSGCLTADGRYCSRPLTATHRIYWNKETKAFVSSFLSYPGGMGYFGDGDGRQQYFWEINATGFDDVERYATEEEMEERVIEVLSRPSRLRKLSDD